MQAGWLAVHAIYFLIGAGPEKEDASASELKKIQGEWIVETHQSGATIFSGNDLKAFGLPLKMAEKEDKLIMSAEKKTVASTVRLDPTQKPKTFDLTLLDGSKKGTSVSGIYELDGDVLKMCVVLGSDKRPTDFAPKDGNLISIWKRKPK